MLDALLVNFSPMVLGETSGALQAAIEFAVSSFTIHGIQTSFFLAIYFLYKSVEADLATTV